MTYFQCALSSAALLWSVSLTYPRRLFDPPVPRLAWPALSADWASTSVVSTPQNYILLSAWSASWPQFPMVLILAPRWGQDLGSIRWKLLEHLFIASLQKAISTAEMPTERFNNIVILSVTLCLCFPWLNRTNRTAWPHGNQCNRSPQGPQILWWKGHLSANNRYNWTSKSVPSVCHSTHFHIGIHNGLPVHSVRDKVLGIMRTGPTTK